MRSLRRAEDVPPLPGWQVRRAGQEFRWRFGDPTYPFTEPSTPHMIFAGRGVNATRPRPVAPGAGHSGTEAAPALPGPRGSALPRGGVAAPRPANPTTTTSGRTG